MSWTSPAKTASAHRAYAEEARPPADHELPHGHVVDRRGLTAAGAVALALTFGAAGGLIDVLTGPGLRTVFAVFFIAGCAIAAFTVHREDLVAAVVMPPLLYVVLALLAGAFSQTVAVGSVLTRQVLELASALVLGAPVLLTATGLAFVIAVLRGLSGRRRTAGRTAVRS